MKRNHLLVPALLLAALAGLPFAGGRTADAQAGLCFPNIPGIANCIAGPFVSYWQTNGALPVFGYPISAVQTRTTTTGAIQAQLFERNRLELHPANAAPYNVLLGRLGADLLAGRDDGTMRREAGPIAGCLWFADTGHNVCDQAAGAGFETYWTSHGLHDPQLNAYRQSLALFGLPLTTAHMETVPGGATVLVQWFERARFEWHPDKPAPYKVLLGLLGDELAAGAAAGGGATPTPQALPTTGIEGKVTIGPVCPGPQRPDDSCADRPYPATISILTAARVPVTQVQADTQGLFAVALSPGTYILVPQSPNIYPRAGEQTVTVQAGQLTRVTIQYDSGIR